MKILFLTDNFMPEVNAPAIRTYEHCKEWAKKGAEVTVITCVPNFPKGIVYKGYKNKLYQTEIIDGIKVVRVWSYISANKGFLKRTIDFISFSITSFIVGLFFKTDIIIATSPQFFTALSGKALSFFKRKPWIMEVRDLWPESIKTVGVMSDNFIIRYFEWLEKRCYKSAIKIISVTDSFKREISAKGIDPKKIEIVKNGVNLKMFSPVLKNTKLLQELDLEGKRILGYIGTHGLAHNLAFILDCAKVLPEYHFIFIGDGTEKENLIRKVRTERIKNVTLLDSIPKEKVKNYISILDVAIINLRKAELFKSVIPSKIFENAAMQIPILLGVDGESRAIIEKYEAGEYFEPENINSFKEKVNMVLSGKGIEKYKSGGDKLAMDFDRKKKANDMFKIISNVLNN